MTFCCVPYCRNKSDDGISMRHFPKNPTRRALWAQNINRKNWEPNDYSCICDVHFSKVMWEKPRVDGKKKLKCNAVPTIFPLPISNNTEKDSVSCEVNEKTECVGTSTSSSNFCEENTNHNLPSHIFPILTESYCLSSSNASLSCKVNETNVETLIAARNLKSDNLTNTLTDTLTDNLTDTCASKSTDLDITSTSNNTLLQIEELKQQLKRISE